MRIGIDVDGVLADFNKSFIERVIGVTGRDLFPARPFDILTWNYPESYGYTTEEVSKVWTDIKADHHFWRSLQPYGNTHTAMAYLGDRARWCRDDIYFITARPGAEAKSQTEYWLQSFMPANRCFLPTVLISSHKGLAAQTLGLDVYIDDRWENCLETAMMHWKGAQPTCKTFLMDRSWNQEHDAEAHGIIRVLAVPGICELAMPNQIAA